MSKILNIYWAVLAITCLLAILFRKDRKLFVVSTAIVHTFVCGCRYEFLTGDLHLYKRTFLTCATYSWNDPRLLGDGRNTLFYMFLKLIANSFNNNYQLLLFLIAAISAISISVVIYRYSESPLISYLMWSCFGFYMFTFSGIKQALAMAFVMFASIGIFEEKRWIFYIMVLIAGFIHMPAFVFLPAYELSRAKKMSSIIRFYIIIIIAVILFRNQIVQYIAELYYENGEYEAVSSYGIGGKTIMMIGLVMIGIFLCNAKIVNYRIVFILMATSSILQVFSVYSNVFTRLADYYFQFVILYAPFILKQPYKDSSEVPILKFNNRSKLLMTLGFVMLALLFYFRVNFNHPAASSVDDMIANFKFFWQ